jgi:hypothetical protein
MRAILVYFIQGEQTKLVKIGQTSSECPHERLMSLQAGSPDILNLLGVVYHISEKDLHERFKLHRVRGEWFHPIQALMKFIEEESTSPNCSCSKYSQSPIPNDEMVRRHIRKLFSHKNPHPWAGYHYGK